ncbi:MAG: hypothetical protein VXX31_17035, partial [Planctomycetota bacterium]|nr:hypothetical protein [Planctomycetota bacterium]
SRGFLDRFLTRPWDDRNCAMTQCRLPNQQTLTATASPVPIFGPGFLYFLLRLNPKTRIAIHDDPAEMLGQCPGCGAVCEKT